MTGLDVLLLVSAALLILAGLGLLGDRLDARTDARNRNHVRRP